MTYAARPFHLTAGLFFGLAVASISASVSAEPGHEAIPTQIDAGQIDAADIEQLSIALPVIESEQPQSPFAAGPLGEVSAADFECMARVVDHEAANQPREGQLAVAYVMINRVLSKRFPNSLCAVAYQPKQFSFIRSHRIREGSQRWETAQAIAREALSGAADDTSLGALFFHARYIAPNSFFRTRSRVASVQDHIFYR